MELGRLPSDLLAAYKQVYESTPVSLIFPLDKMGDADLNILLTLLQTWLYAVAVGLLDRVQEFGEAPTIALMERAGVYSADEYLNLLVEMYSDLGVGYVSLLDFQMVALRNSSLVDVSRQERESRYLRLWANMLMLSLVGNDIGVKDFITVHTDADGYAAQTQVLCLLCCSDYVQYPKFIEEQCLSMLEATAKNDD